MPLWIHTMEKAERDSYPAMRTALDKNNEESLSALRKYLNFPNPMFNKNDLLHSAAQAGNTTAINFLLQQGADINTQNPLGNTPLHQAAAYKGRKDAIELLLEAGADIDIKNSKDETAFELFLKNPHKRQNLDEISQIFFNHLQKKCLRLEQELAQKEHRIAYLTSIPQKIARIKLCQEAAGTFNSAWRPEDKALWSLVQNNGILLGRK